MTEGRSKKENKRSFSVSLAQFAVRSIFDVLFYILVAALIIFICRNAYSFCYDIFGKKSISEKQNSKQVSVVIYDNDKPMKTAEMLEDTGLVKNKYSFEIRRTLEKKNYRAGIYNLDTAMDYGEILEIIGETK